MNMKLLQKTLATSLATAILLIGSGSARADAVIYNTGLAATGTVALGINDDGSLNSPTNIVANSSRTGLAYRFADGSFRDATSPGCFCEGWGVSVNGAHRGYANVSTDGGPVGLSFGALTGVTGSTATATASITSLPGITITQAYQPASNAPGALFRNHVTITNTTGAAVNDVKYVRVMDWDVPPTEFSEMVTIRGTASTTLLEQSHDNGFSTANPLGVTAPIIAGTLDIDFTDSGPADHGAYFRFNFGTLEDGESIEFDIFYGAAGSETAALAAIAAEGLELYSLGQSNGGSSTGTPATYIFGFTGVGGVPVTDIPEPATLGLLGLGILGLAASRRRKQA